MSDWGDDNPTVIRVVRKKVQQGGHHGGAWKVAYADFVTAMMAFFLVMWIVGMDESAKDSVQSYFNDPAGYMKQSTSGNGVLPSGTSLFNTSSAPMAHPPMMMTGKKSQIHGNVAPVSLDGFRAALPDRG